MKIIISKDQYRRVLLKYLDSFIGDLVVDPYTKNSFYRNVKTSDGTEFAMFWRGSAVTQGCKRELTLENEFLDDFESFIPLNRKKVFSEVLLEYFTLKTRIKCDCIEFHYHTGKYKEYDLYDDEEEQVIHHKDKIFNHYKYKIPKKR